MIDRWQRSQNPYWCHLLREGQRGNQFNPGLFDFGRWCFVGWSRR